MRSDSSSPNSSTEFPITEEAENKKNLTLKRTKETFKNFHDYIQSYIQDCDNDDFKQCMVDLLPILDLYSE